MLNDRIRLGVIGMGLANMASTLILLKDVPDLRYEITGDLHRACWVGPKVRRRFRDCLLDG